MERISQNVYVETDFLGCTVGFVVTSQGVVMIDTPQKPSEATIWRRRVIENGELRYIINTDHHGDHSMGNGFFPQGLIIAQHGTREKFRSTQEFRERGRIIEPSASRLMEEYEVRKPSITFGESLNIHLGEHTFELFHTPGHNENTIAVFIPKERVLFTGDNVCTEGFPDISQSDVIGWLQSLKRLKKMDADLIVPGHRQIGDKMAISKFEEDFRGLIGKVRDALDSGVSREELPRIVSFPDKVHERYPQRMKEIFGDKSKASVIRIYDVLVEARARGESIQ